MFVRKEKGATKVEELDRNKRDKLFSKVVHMENYI